MPSLLFIDTSGSRAIVAVSQGFNLLSQSILEDTKSQAAFINEMIEKVLEKAKIGLSDINAFCVCGGPGSYTGLRVSLGVVKGLAFILDKKILLFDKLSLIAAGFNEKFPSKEKVVVLKARKEEYFYAHFGIEGNIICTPMHIFKEALALKLNLLNNDALLITDDNVLNPPIKATILNENYQLNITSWIILANYRFQHQSWDDLAYCEPFYLKEAFTTQSKKWNK